jgi:hypothetical protein
MKKKGTLFNDRKLAGELRTITNQIAFRWLTKYENGELTENDDIKFAKEILLKCLGASLPRLNEHTGADGAELNLIPLTTINALRQNFGNGQNS